MDPRMPEDREGFEIAAICVLNVEFAAVELLMEPYFFSYGKAAHDRSSYMTGLLGGKPVVLATPRNMGSLNAANLANEMRASFPNIKLALLVGVAGGAPSTTGDKDRPILLGDVVISTQVIQHDFGRQCPSGFRIKTGVRDTLGRPNEDIARFVGLLERSIHARRRLSEAASNGAIKCKGRSGGSDFDFDYPGLENDNLFPSHYRHKHSSDSDCETCRNCTEIDSKVCEQAEGSTCEDLGCDKSKCDVKRQDSRRQSSLIGSSRHPPVNIHFGAVASGSAVIKSGWHRDNLVKELNVIAFEMEGAGSWDNLPTVVVKGICDYADSHKSKRWQEFAAATAAACAEEIVQAWTSPDKAMQGL
jgi:nucleoside phosphorylase